MNANRNNNNRRRGRPNNGGRNGGSQSNRIDSRARGNAPQMLEKYRKLAHDASLNGDRVQTEYYLQFADHYFRVIADSRTAREEGQVRRYGERDASDEFDGEQDDEFELPGRSPRQQPRREEREEREPREQRDQRESREPRDQREPREPREYQRDSSRDNTRAVADSAEAPVAAAEGAAPGEDDRNPFLREARPKRTRAPRRDAVRDTSEAGRDAAPAAPSADSIDASVLPPSIARSDEADEPRPVRRTRRPRVAKGDGEETLETLS